MYWLRLLVPIFASLFLVLAWWCRRAGHRRTALGAWLGLGLLALGAVGMYNANHIERRRFTNNYEMYHYYLPTHYAAELGYKNLYAATTEARSELGFSPPDTIRNLRSGKLVPSAALKEEGQRAKARFGKMRWAQFKEDISWFSSQINSDLWKTILQDKGYNATPVWTMVGRFFARQVRASPEGFTLLSLLDVAFWALALRAVHRNFGSRSLLILLIVLGTLYPTHFNTLKAAFMRIDWLCCLLLAMAAERRGRSGLAGVLVALAGLSRVFPFVFAFGPLVTLLYRGWVDRLWDRRALRFLLFFGATVTLLGLASVLSTSPAYWGAFFDKIRLHQGDFTGRRIGFTYLAAGAWDGHAWRGVSVKSFYAANEWLSALTKGGALACGALLAIRLREPWERLVIGLFLMFFLVETTEYYYVVLLIPTLWLSSRLRDVRAVALLCLGLLGSALTHLAYDRWGRGYETTFTQEMVVLVQIVGMAWLMARDPDGARLPG